MATKISGMTPLVGPMSGDEMLEISAGVDPDFDTFSVTARQIADLATPRTLPVTGTATDLDADHAGAYMRFTNASAKTLTVHDDASEPLPDDFEAHGRNVGTADLTLVADGVTIHAPAGGSLVVPQGGTFTIKRVDVDEFDLFGVTKP